MAGFSFEPSHAPRNERIRLLLSFMDNRSVSAAVDRAITTYTMMGLRGDQEQRQALRENVTVHIRKQFDKGQHDIDRLTVLALKHLVSLEDRDPVRAGRSSA